MTFKKQVVIQYPDKATSLMEFIDAEEKDNDYIINFTKQFFYENGSILSRCFVIEK